MLGRSGVHPLRGGGLWFSRGSGRWEMGDPGVRVRLGGLFWLLPSSLGVSVGSSPWPLGALRQLGFQLVLLPFGPNPVARAGTAGALLGFPRIPLQISILAVPSPPPRLSPSARPLGSVGRGRIWPGPEQHRHPLRARGGRGVGGQLGGTGPS